jgi:malate synthase
MSGVERLAEVPLTVDASLEVGDLLTPDVLRLVGEMQRVHRSSLRALLQRRTERAAIYRDGFRPALPEETADIRTANWRVAPAPADLVDRRVEITGPADRRMMAKALGCGARVFMADLEDSLSPTWANITNGLRNVRDAAEGQLGPDADPSGRPTTLVVRPRGLHLPEPHVEVDEGAASAALFDATVLAATAAPAFQARGTSLYLYLPKLEHYHEAEWWDAVLADLERRLGLPYASIRVTVLIETILAAFQMDEILWALRDRITGLNAGRWDYLFSLIKRLGAQPEFVLPDRAAVTMAVPFMAAYASRLVEACHRRGAHAIGGMAAFVPSRQHPEQSERAFAAVAADKQREAALGYDGTWVAHPDLVPVAQSVFDEVLGEAPNQLNAFPPAVPDEEALLDTAVAGASVTLAGVHNNVSVSLRYLAAWLEGRGAVAINSLMEDAATAEIARAQLWQWVRHGVPVDGAPVDAVLIERILSEQVELLRADGADTHVVAHAAAILRHSCLGDDLPEFVTVLGLPYLHGR